MKIEKMEIDGVWLGHSPIHTDHRGYFREWFRCSEIQSSIGHELEISQSNISMSNKGVLRGIHYSLAPQGQAKWITCIVGSIWDVAVDLRVTSPTFGKWIGFTLTADSGHALFISEGLGHGFISLEDNSVVSYLLTSPYSPSQEFEINPHDQDLGIEWPLAEHFLSQRDENAPTLRSRLAQGNLPNLK